MRLLGARVWLGEVPSDYESEMGLGTGDSVERCHIIIEASESRTLTKPLLEVGGRAVFTDNHIEVRARRPRGMYIRFDASAEVAGNRVVVGPRR